MRKSAGVFESRQNKDTGEGVNRESGSALSVPEKKVEWSQSELNSCISKTMG